MKTHLGFQRLLRRGFTLVELLVVIAIMAILAALITSLAGTVARKKTIARAQAEMGKLETTIEAYKAKMGFYPPGNGQTALEGPQRPSAAVNQLFYELTGTVFNGSTRFTNVLGEAISTNSMGSFFGVTGFVNSSTDPREVVNFYRSLKSDELGNRNTVNAPVRIFVLPVEGPRGVYFQDADGHWVTPWFYDASSANRFNADSYDLWIDIILGGKTNRICNWSDQPLIVN